MMFHLKTTGDAYAMKAVVIKDTEGKSGVVQIPVSIVDKNGNTVYASENEITVSIKGNTVLLGLESGSSSSHEDYKGNKRKALHGRLIAYVRLENNTGNTTIEFSSTGLQSQKMILK